MTHDIGTYSTSIKTFKNNGTEREKSNKLNFLLDSYTGLKILNSGRIFFFFFFDPEQVPMTFFHFHSKPDGYIKRQQSSRTFIRYVKC